MFATNDFKSIKWRLQIWYGLILVVVLAGFGFTAYQLERGRPLRRIDDELHRRVTPCDCAIRRRRQIERPPLTARRPASFPTTVRRTNSRPPTEFHLPPQAPRLFDTNDRKYFYYVDLDQ